jgi:uncharacterized protein YceK
MKNRSVVVSLVVLSLVLGGCGSYYIVKDPSSGRAYYATEVDKSKSGTVSFKDEKTGSSVTLQNSEVREVGKDEYNAGLKQASPPPAK